MGAEIKMSRLLHLFFVLIVLGFAVTANAELIDRGGGLIYDTDLNVTWLQNANLFGPEDWFAANSMVSNLVYYDAARNVYWDDWRLPTVPYHDPTCSQQFAGTPTKSYGFNCTGNEFGHLYYTELGNLSFYAPDGSTQPGYGLINSGPFINLKNNDYWLQQEEFSYYAYFFSNYLGELSATSSWAYKYVLPVRDGDVVTALEPIRSIDIDIKPGSYPNIINLKSKGVIPVATLTNEGFDATTVDPLSVAFGPNKVVEAHGKGHIKDVDGDGDLDLVLHFRNQQTGIACGDTEAGLTGETFDGQMIEGLDSIHIVQCKLSKRGLR